MSTQIFEVTDIPTSLWDPSHEHGIAKLPKGKLRLPIRLEEAYRQALDDLGLIAMASDISDREVGPIGEQGEDGAHEHFAKCYSGSCGRVQLFALDPLAQFYTDVVTVKLASRQPGAHEAYLRFLEMQSGPYLAHQEWLKDYPHQKSETVRFSLLAARTKGLVMQNDWLASLTETNEKLRRLKPGARQVNLI
jgi:hypothetical protein